MGNEKLLMVMSGNINNYHQGEVLIILKKRLAVHNNEEVATLGKIIGSLHSLI